MRIIGVLALSVAACGSGDDGFPVGGPGTDGGLVFPDAPGTGKKDGAVDAPGDSTTALVDANLFDGRVCLLTDPRKLDVCATTGAGGLTVRLGSAAVTTADDGSFVIPGQSGSDLVWRITGSNIISSFEPLKDYFIPAITTTAFNAMLSGSTPSAMQVPGEGSLMLFVSYNGVGASGHTVATDPQGFYNPYYDGSTASAWQQTATGSNGAAWIPGIDVGTVKITVDGSAPSPASPSSAPIFDGGITFSNIILSAP